jgi:hypothetical protein
MALRFGSTAVSTSKTWERWCIVRPMSWALALQHNANGLARSRIVVVVLIVDNVGWEDRHDSSSKGKRYGLKLCPQAVGWSPKFGSTPCYCRTHESCSNVIAASGIDISHRMSPWKFLQMAVFWERHMIFNTIFAVAARSTPEPQERTCSAAMTVTFRGVAIW